MAEELIFRFAAESDVPWLAKDESGAHS